MQNLNGLNKMYKYFKEIKIRLAVVRDKSNGQYKISLTRFASECQIKQNSFFGKYFLFNLLMPVVDLSTALFSNF